MRVIIDEDAYGDIDHIAAWIAKDSPRAARNVVQKIIDAIERLSLFPEMGRRGRAHGTLERVVSGTPYIVVYEISRKPDAVVVTAVFHGSQDR